MKKSRVMVVYIFMSNLENVSKIGGNDMDEVFKFTIIYVSEGIVIGAALVLIIQKLV